MRKTLLWHQGALGDLLLSLPAIHAIRCGTDTDHLHLVSRTDLHEIFLASGIIDGASSNENGLFSSLFGGIKPAEGRLGDFLYEYRSAFIFARNPDPVFLRSLAEYVPRLFPIRTVPPAGEIIHVADFQLSQLAAAGVSPTEEVPVLDAVPGTDSDKWANAVTVHPGSGGKAKCWPVEKCLECISLLLESGHRVRVLFGPAEEGELFQAVAEGIERKGLRADIVRDQTLSSVASLLKSSSLYVGNDSGITHLASALGVPTVALFGPTDHRLWRPCGRKTRIVRSAAACSPCSEKEYRRCTDRRCLGTIGANMVMEEIAGLI